jgi:hypothetical protein
MRRVIRDLIRLLDRLLRKQQGVFEYWDDPGCMFRASTGRARHTIRLPDGEIPTGAEVLQLHFWNEHMPRISAEGPDLALAVRGHRMLIASLRAFARRIQDDASFAGYRAVGGATVLFAAGDASSGERLFQRLGFSVFPYRNPLGRIGEFWENLYTWALMWAFNAISLQKRHLLQLQRTEVWMSTDEFLARYGTREG